MSRTTVYELIRMWHATGGAMGLRAVKLGRSLRVPRIALLEFLGSRRRKAGAMASRAPAVAVEQPDPREPVSS